MNGDPQQAEAYDYEEGSAPPPANGDPAPIYRGNSGDPAFGFLLAMAVSIGLIPMLPGNADLRYTLAWGALATVGVLAWLLGNMDRIGQELPENVFWGILFGILISLPFDLFAINTLGRVTRLVFPDLQAGSILAYLVFVMPMAETLFFRGLMQRQIVFWLVGILAAVWNIALFFPVMWGQILENVAVAVYLGITLLVMNLLLSYVRERNGLAAAWIAQIVAVLILFFIPFISNPSP